MQKKMYPLLFLGFGLLACNSNDRGTASGTSDSDIDAARNFIQAALVGDFQRAKIFMIDDSLNHEDLNAIQRLNERLTTEEKEKYQEASIRIHQNRKIMIQQASFIIPTPTGTKRTH
jgi:plasmid maintenance system killer protein